MFILGSMAQLGFDTRSSVRMAGSSVHYPHGHRERSVDVELGHLPPFIPSTFTKGGRSHVAGTSPLSPCRTLACSGTFAGMMWSVMTSGTFKTTSGSSEMVAPSSSIATPLLSKKTVPLALSYTGNSANCEYFGCHTASRHPVEIRVPWRSFLSFI